MEKKKQNCWEFKRCCREVGGSRVHDLGICPAAADTSFDGLSGGTNAGRICWAVAGTFCGGEVQGTFADKRESCVSCDFFKEVQSEEGVSNVDTKFLRFLSEDARAPFLKGMAYKHIKAGVRFIRQGDVLDVAYIIQRGSCLVIVEKDEKLYPVRHLGEGDIVGELTILTGEPQNGHVEAQTEMDVWVIKKEQFIDLSGRDPDVLNFLTELVADRFDSMRTSGDRTIGKYVATDVIGSGGYSIVYKGFHRTLNFPVAIKMMRHNLALCDEFLENFWNEAKTIAGFNHENLIKIYDIEERYRTVFIIMELAEGESLKKMIGRLRVIPPPVAADLLSQTCRGLGYAHRKGILHQDINPSNILVETGDRIKIIDFGVACPTGSDDRSIFEGTIHYMAPEQIACKPVDPRTDIYSLGITAYEMVTGGRPYPEGDIRNIMDMHLNHDIPDPAERVVGLPEPLRRFILKACNRDPGKRYQKAEQAIEELESLVTGFEALRQPRYPDPIETLVNEHGLIRQFLDNLSMAAGELEVDERPQRAFFEKAIEFARRFTDRFHHFKEEQVMFVKLAEKKGGLLDGEIEALRHQHERGRTFIAGLSAALDGYAAGDETATTTLLENLASYIHLLRHHIHKEDHRFFPIARQAFSEKELQGLADLFEKEDGDAGTFEENRRLVQEMAGLL